MALQYGKRPAYLISLVANIIIMATAPLCTTPRTYQASRILLGLFGAPVESLCEISIADIVTPTPKDEFQFPVISANRKSTVVHT